jgi:dCTP deaminase
MSVLTGPEIERVYHSRQILDGAPVLPYIDVSPWPGLSRDPAAGPNSLDVRLGAGLKRYDVDRDQYRYYHDHTGRQLYGPVLDSRKQNRTVSINFTPEGLIFVPGILYLGHTVETVECHGLVPCLETRSSIARLGVSIHLSAGFGDDGSNLQWTLEITVQEPVVLYPGERVAQVYFTTIVGERRPYVGKYQKSFGAVGSLLWKDNEKTRDVEIT